jgi:hypothetical protein
MAIPRKRSKKKLYITLFLLFLLIVSVAAVAYAAWPRAPVATLGVHVGDSFTYSITGSVSFQSLDATMTPGFEVYNQTDYYRVIITGITGTNVTMDTVWRFKNGSQVDQPLTIDLSNGKQNKDNGFWAIYSSNLNVGDLVRPNGFDKQRVNATSPQKYADSTRQRNMWFIENQFEDTRDPTHSTLMDVFNQIYFDKQTGMLDTLNSISSYNNPLKTEAITWKLISCTVWNVQ